MFIYRLFQKMQRTSQNKEDVEGGEPPSDRDAKNPSPDTARSSSYEDDSENSNPNDESRCSSKNQTSGPSSPYKLEPGSPVDPAILSQKNHHAIVKEMRDQNIQLQAVNRKATDFYFLKMLGEGSFSTVSRYLVLHLQ